VTSTTTYYLGSNELTAWARPRAVAILEQVSGGIRVALDPPAPGGATDLVLRPRYAGESIGGTELPVTVNIFDREGSHIGIGELYATAEEAGDTSGGLRA
jgi:hypothetical protein